MLGKICSAGRSSIHKITSLPCHKLHSFSALINAILICKTVNDGHTGVQVFELFSCVYSFFCSDKSTYLLNSRMKTSYKPVVVSRLKPRYSEMWRQNLSHNSIRPFIRSESSYLKRGVTLPLLKNKK